MPTFLVTQALTGPQYDPARPLEEQSDWTAHIDFVTGLGERGVMLLAGPLAGGELILQVVEAESEDAVRTIVGADPWNDSHLRTTSVQEWILRVDHRRTSPA
jgi:uncharacterized protein YciI